MLLCLWGWNDCGMRMYMCLYSKVALIVEEVLYSNSVYKNAFYWYHWRKKRISCEVWWSPQRALSSAAIYCRISHPTSIKNLFETQEISRAKSATRAMFCQYRVPIHNRSVCGVLLVSCVLCLRLRRANAMKTQRVFLFFKQSHTT